MVVSGDVFVVGAGASAYLGLPLLNSFRQRANQIQQEGVLPPEESAAMLAGLDWWNNYLPDANAEEMFILVDLMNQLAHYWLEGGESDNWQTQESFRYMLPVTLLESASAGVDPTPHRRLLESLRTVHQTSKSVTPVICLNWDDVFEQVEPNANAWMVGGRIAEYVDLEPATCAIDLIKIHGSLNWWFCTNCSRLTLLEDRTEVRDAWRRFASSVRPKAFHATISCRRCGEKTARPAMLPPVSAKLTRDAAGFDLFTGVWQQALDAFWGRRRVIVIGYSFPRTDVQFRMLFLEGLAGVLGIEEVLVVTHPANEHSQEFRETFRQLIRTAKFRGQLAFNFEGFEKWVESYRPSSPRPKDWPRGSTLDGKT